MLANCKFIYAFQSWINQQNHSNLPGDIGDLLFQRTLGMLDHPKLKLHAGLNLGKKCIQLSDAAPSHEIFRKIYFVVKA